MRIDEALKDLEESYDYTGEELNHIGELMQDVVLSSGGIVTPDELRDEEGKLEPKAELEDFEVGIKELHEVTVMVKAPPGSSRDTIIELANKKFEDEGSNQMEYDRTLDEDKWVVRDSKGNYLE